MTAFTCKSTKCFLIIYFTLLGKNSLEVFICVQELTVQRLWRAPTQGWLTSCLAGEAVACQFWLSPCRVHAVTGFCWEELSKEKDDSQRERERGKTPNKRGWNGVISFFLCNLQYTAKPSHCRVTGGQKPFSAVTRYIAPANNGRYLLMPFRDSHACAALFAGQGKTSLSTYQAYRYKMLVAVLLALSIWLAWFISVETEDSVSSCWVLPW